MVRMNSNEKECTLKTEIWNHLLQINALMESCDEDRKALALRIHDILRTALPAPEFSEEFLRGEPTMNGRLTN